MSVLILSYNPPSHLQSGILIWGFLNKVLHEMLTSPMRPSCPANLFFLDLIILTTLLKQYKLWRSPLRNSLHSLLTSPLLSLNILPSLFLWNTLELCCFLAKRNKIWFQYKTAGKTIFPFILISTFSDPERNTKDSELSNEGKHSFNLPLILSHIHHKNALKTQWHQHFPSVLKSLHFELTVSSMYHMILIINKYYFP
jgi:hypothetical protein